MLVIILATVSLVIGIGCCSITITGNIMVAYKKNDTNKYKNKHSKSTYTPCGNRFAGALSYDQLRSVFLASKKFLSLVDYLQATFFASSTGQVYNEPLDVSLTQSLQPSKIVFSIFLTHSSVYFNPVSVSMKKPAPTHSKPHFVP